MKSSGTIGRQGGPPPRRSEVGGSHLPLSAQVQEWCRSTSTAWRTTARLARRVESHDWSSGWTSTEFYEVGGKVFGFFLKRSDGTVHIHRMRDDGTVGEMVKSYDWSSGWTSVEFYRVGGKVFVFFLKQSDGTVHIHRMRDDGTVGEMVKSYDWSSGWTSAEFYKVGGKVFVFFLKYSDGAVHIHRMRDDGTVGEMVKSYDWSSGWTSAEFYRVDGKVFVFFLKYSDGIVHIHRMRDDGTVGRELPMTPEITMYAPRSIGQRSGLSNADIAAANYRIGKAEPVNVPESALLSPDPPRTRRQRKVYGNRRTKELHVGSCTHGSKMHDKNRVSFASVDEGVAQGYNGCFYCLRRYDTG